jgi:hypothetical protein
LDGLFSEIGRGKRRVLGSRRRSSLDGRISGLLGGAGDDGDVVLGDAHGGDDAKVGSKGLVRVGRVEYVWLPVDLDLGERLEHRDHRVLRLLVAFGGGWLERGADLRATKDVRLSALASVVAAGTKGVIVECRGHLLVVEDEGFGRGDGVESEPTKEGSILMHGLLEMRGEGSKEGGVTGFEDFGASGSLACEGSVVVVEREVEEGSQEAISRLDRGCSCMRSNLVKGEDVEPSEAGREGDDLAVGVKGARRGAEVEEGMLKFPVNLFPAVRQIVRLESALEMAQVVLDALPEEEKSRLERERGELFEQLDP